MSMKWMDCNWYMKVVVIQIWSCYPIAYFQKWPISLFPSCDVEILRWRSKIERNPPYLLTMKNDFLIDHLVLGLCSITNSLPIVVHPSSSPCKENIVVDTKYFVKTFSSRPNKGVFWLCTLNHSVVLAVFDFHSKNLQITSKLLTQGYIYHTLRKTFGKFFYNRSTLNLCLNMVQYPFRNISLLSTNYGGQRRSEFHLMMRSDSKIVKRLRRRQYDLAIIERTILCSALLQPCTDHSEIKSVALWLTKWLGLHLYMTGLV